MAKRFFWIFFGIIALGAASRGFPVAEEAEAEAASIAQASANPWSVGAPSQSDSNKVALGEASQSSWSGGEVSLERQRDGHFYANITVDARPMRVLVDTGASIVALTGNDARRLGLDWNASEVRPIGRGASGDVYGVPVMLESINLEGIEAKQVNAVIVPEGLDITLLGQSFLSQVEKVEISGNTMKLTD